MENAVEKTIKVIWALTYREGETGKGGYMSVEDIVSELTLHNWHKDLTREEITSILETGYNNSLLSYSTEKEEQDSNKRYRLLNFFNCPGTPYKAPQQSFP